MPHKTYTDFIYSEYLASAGRHQRNIVWQIAQDYAHATALLRLPGHCPMPAFPHIVDVPMVVRPPRKGKHEVVMVGVWWGRSWCGCGGVMEACVCLVCVQQMCTTAARVRRSTYNTTHHHMNTTHIQHNTPLQTTICTPPHNTGLSLPGPRPPHPPPRAPHVWGPPCRVPSSFNRQPPPWVGLCGVWRGAATSSTITQGVYHGSM